MSRVALKIEKYSSDELKALLRKDEKFQQGVRLDACYQVSKGQNLRNWRIYMKLPLNQFAIGLTS